MRTGCALWRPSGCRLAWAHAGTTGRTAHSESLVGRAAPRIPHRDRHLRVSCPSARWQKSRNPYRLVRLWDRAAIRAGTFGRNTTRNSGCRDEGPHPVNGTPGTGSCVCVPGQQHRASLENQYLPVAGIEHHFCSRGRAPATSIQRRPDLKIPIARPIPSTPAATKPARPSDGYPSVCKLDPACITTADAMTTAAITIAKLRRLLDRSISRMK